MWVRSFQIRRFGMLSHVTVDDLSPGLCLFLGHNEAGKSTCLEFFRAMLTGYPPQGKHTHSPTRPEKKAPRSEEGGSLYLESEFHGPLRLCRQPGPGAFQLFNSQGALLENSVLDQLMGGVTREIYRTIYGFSLSELQNFHTLDSEAVRNALYGASFGLGLNAPAAALRHLEQGMAALYKVGSKSLPLNRLLARWDALQKQVREQRAEAARFDPLCAQADQVHKEVQRLRAEKSRCLAEASGLERQLNVWKQWEEWRLCQARLERLNAERAALLGESNSQAQGTAKSSAADSSKNAPALSAFPEDALPRLERLLEEKQESQNQALMLSERMEKLEASLENDRRTLQEQEYLLAHQAELRRLWERKTSFRNALHSLPVLTVQRDAASADLARQLTNLGPDWTTADIRALDRSVFVREEIERFSVQLQTATSQRAAASAAFDRVLREVDYARNNLDTASLALNALPEAEAELDLPTREALRAALAQVEQGRLRQPECKKALSLSHTEYSRALAHLNLREGEHALEAITKAQGEVLALAEEVRVRTEAAKAAAREAQLAHKEEDATAERLNRVLAQENNTTGMDRASLDKRKDYLRRLRQAASLQSQEELRLAGMKERLQEGEAALPRPRPAYALLGIGALLFLAGGSILLAKLIFDIHSIQVPPLPEFLGIHELVPNWDNSLPITLLGGYLGVLSGILMLSLGWPHSGPNKAHALAQLDQVRSQRDAAQVRLAELNAEVQEMCTALGLRGPDAVLLDALEAQLDKERELCVAGERLQQESAHLRLELEQKHKATQHAEHEHALAEASVQTLRRRWHDFLIRLGALSVPAPEAAATFFARVETTRLLQVGTKALEEEMRDLAGRKSAFLRQVRQILPAHLGLPPLPTFGEDIKSTKTSENTGISDENPALCEQVNQTMAVVRRVLDSCRAADALVEEKIRATEALRAAEHSLQRTEQAHDDAILALRQAHEDMVRQNQAWQTHVEKMGLGSQLSPATTREALDCMERCLNLESECQRLQAEIYLQQREYDAVAGPLTALLQQWQEQAPEQAEFLGAGTLNNEEKPDWLALLDSLTQGAEQAQDVADTVKKNTALLAEYQAEAHQVALHEHSIATSLEKLLALAGAADTESFRHLATLAAEQHELSRRQEHLEDVLTLAAGASALESFVQSFAGRERSQVEVQAAELARSLAQLEETEQEQAAQLTLLNAQKKALASSHQLGDLLEEEAALEAQLKDMAHEWARLALARSLLVSARQSFEKNRQPEVIRLASALFSRITEQAWAGVSAELADGSLRVLPQRGPAVRPEVLSRGAQEQLYLALRLAHIQCHAQGACPLPIIMDDILVNFDPQRASSTMQALADLTTATPGHQILFFTCHPHIATELRQRVPNTRLYHVNHGTICMAEN